MSGDPNTVPVPGELLRSTVFMGFTLDELIYLGTIPLVIILPTIVLDQIPIWVSLVLLVVITIMMLFVVVWTPTGQSPLKWFPEFVRRKINPNTYYRKPKDSTDFGERDVEYQHRIYTAEKIKEESEMELTEEYIEELRENIEYAEKL